MTETLAHGYSSESTQRELSNEDNMTRFRGGLKLFAPLCFGQKVALALEGGNGLDVCTW